jgi:hypothetical protein
MPDPIIPDDQARLVLHQKAVEAKAAEARTPGDWFDIFTGIVTFGVKSTLEGMGRGAEAAEKLRDQQPYWREVRRVFEDHGLPLSESVEWEGPHVFPDQFGFPTNVEWPLGEWVKFYWPEEKKKPLEFRGQYALVAVSFIIWWTNFNMVHKTMGGVTEDAKRRIIKPGEDEWKRYMTAKKADQAAGIEPESN